MLVRYFMFARLTGTRFFQPSLSLQSSHSLMRPMHDDDDDYYSFIVFEDSSDVGIDACHGRTARVPAGRVYL